MKPCERLIAVKYRTSGDYILLMLDIICQNLFEVERFRLVIYQGKHIYRKGVLKLRVFIQQIHDDIAVYVLLEIDDYSHSVSARFVAQIGYTFDLFVVYKVGYTFYKHRLVDLIRDLGVDYRLSAAVLLKVILGAQSDFSAAGRVSLVYAVFAVYGRAGGKIRSLYVLHQIHYCAVGVIH